MVNKYGTAPAAARTIGGVRFDSKAEMTRYLQLRMLEVAGKIRDLELQVEYALTPSFTSPAHGKIRPIRYFADFRYLEVSTNRVIVEDVKGCLTDVYRIKRTLLLWKYPDINFVEIRT
jgi:hypothetical protein